MRIEVKKSKMMGMSDTELGFKNLDIDECFKNPGKK